MTELALPIAGLISDNPLDKVTEKLEKLEKTAKDLGCKIDSPFGLLSFLALPVLPELRLTDKGLVDVSKAKIVNLFE